MATKKFHKDIVIAPSVLSADFSRLGQEVKSCVRAGCPWIHLDVMDNHFVPNLTFGAPVVKKLRKASAKAYFDAHLMTEKPETLMDAFAEAGVQNLTVHSEACGDNLLQVLRSIRELGMKAGVSIKPKTSVDAIKDVLGEVDLVLIMTVEPGFGGQALLPKCLNKIREIKKLREKHGYTYRIQADGGINLSTVNLVVASGAEILVAGSAVFNEKPLADNVAAMLKAAR